jgi:hypothetical protein
LAAIPVLAAAMPDFSGTWTMDGTRSESAHQDVPIGAVTLTIRQTASAVSIETNRKASKGSGAFHETVSYNLDGTETAAIGEGGAKVTAKARWEGDKLVTETARNVQDSTVTTLWVQSLDATGREMTVVKTLTVQHGYMGQTAKTAGHATDVFVKKEAR